MLLEKKTAIIYGGSGAVGSSVAHAFAREGAQVFLAGRTKESLASVVEAMRKEDGVADFAVVDETKTPHRFCCDRIASVLMRAGQLSQSECQRDEGG